MWLDLRRFTSPELELDRVFSALPVIYHQSPEPQQIDLFSCYKYATITAYFERVFILYNVQEQL